MAEFRDNGPGDAERTKATRAVQDADDVLVYLDVTVRIPRSLVEGETQKSIAEWMDDEYLSVAGFLADHDVAYVLARVCDPRNRFQDYQRVIDAWKATHSDGCQEGRTDG